ncbi:hypothetical protein CBR_g20073 [Chara braunii]|uniref:DUF4360 domain-containing protein n=1 Tax=Chara braunii TaxID=69332 RepID=A0A388KZR2_CHABU|nr:hypothetical protein CBR_g20073 [Chara braunii]|eukprot:GBG75443.1 hypothetical protein CBR_g20073 [Chara braunii]
MAAAAPMLLLVLVLQLAAHASAISPPGDSVRINYFSAAGSGCPPGSTQGSISSDGKALTVMYGNYTASTDGSLADQRKACTVTVSLSYPRGFVVKVGTVTLRGYANLEKGVTGTVKTQYYFSGLLGTAKVSRTINGRFNNNFEFTDQFVSAVYSKCGVQRSLNLLSEVRVNPGSSGKNGIVTIDSQDLALVQVLQLIWETC